MLKFNNYNDRISKYVRNLNTSHVKVQRAIKGPGSVEYSNLNTSHVKVQLLAVFTMFFNIFYLNTSHVKVQHKAPWLNKDVKSLFKYISC